ncbi:MAG: D-2-hydroxyacid dehydrogenase [Lachnospiraceae bacterium]|nr:D-2-hydroxyacid dehydrogenase [Lachnospiraceae bacterium]
MKIVVLDGYTLNPGDLSWEDVKKWGEVEIYDRTPTEQIVERIKDADAVLTNKGVLDKEVLASCKNLKFIGTLATGYNNIDVQAAKELGIVVSNVPAYGTNAVAQFTFALLLEICNQVAVHNQSVKEGEWTNNIDWCYWKTPLMELAGKTMGIIGFGRIGQKVAQIATAFDMKVLAYDEYQNLSLETENIHYASLDTLLQQSDIISLHCPLFESNVGMINKETIQKMKDGAILLNAARGPLVNEADLSEALESGKVYFAGLDVVSTEQIQMDNPLMKAKHSFITPHIAWAPTETRARMMEIVSKNLQGFIEGKPVNVVNL